MGTEPKSGRLRKKCARLGLCSMHTEPCQYTVWWFLFPPPLPSLFIFTLSSLSRKNSPLSQLPGYIQCENTGSRSPPGIMFLREVYPALELLEQGANNSRTGSKGIRKLVCWACKKIREGETEKFPWRRLVGPVSNMMPGLETFLTLKRWPFRRLMRKKLCLAVELQD